MKALVLATGMIAATSAMAETPVLTIYAPDYFTSEWGPGPAIEAGFEATCGCDIQYQPGDLLPRLLLEGARTRADVVIGLNTDVSKQARDSGLFAPHDQDLSGLTLPVDWRDDTFLPFNWGYTAFVYNSENTANPPASFQALLDAPDDAYKIVIQDPRSSISGLALLLWVKDIYGDNAFEAWQKLAPKVLTVTKGWSESYGLFTDGEADMVMSYTTSPAYHIIAEGDTTKVAAIFPEGHYFMAELVARTATTKQPALAEAFLAYVLSAEFQQMIPTANWSYPSALPYDQWPDGFRDLPLPDKAIFYNEDQAAALRDSALDEWLTAFGG